MTKLYYLSDKEAKVIDNMRLSISEQFAKMKAAQEKAWEEYLASLGSDEERAAEQALKDAEENA